MPLEDTSRIINVAGGKEHLGGIEQVNDLLRRGWILIGYYVDKNGGEIEHIEQPHFVLAWQSNIPYTDDRWETLWQQWEDRMKDELSKLGINPEDAEKMTSAIYNGGQGAMAIAMFITMAMAK